MEKKIDRRWKAAKYVLYNEAHLENFDYFQICLNTVNKRYPSQNGLVIRGQTR